MQMRIAFSFSFSFFAFVFFLSGCDGFGFGGERIAESLTLSEFL
jgi:hypothetical protein